MVVIGQHSAAYHQGSRLLAWINFNPNMNKTVSFQKEAMRTQVALWFLWSETVCREVPLCLKQQNGATHKLENLLLWKIVIRMKLLDLIEFFVNETRP